VDLQGLFKALAPRRDPNLLVGIETMDDAAIYQLSPDQALVITADFITPVVDDPFRFGQVAAANSLSDVYAMGGRPITALNLCNFPARGVDLGTLGRILQGGLDKIHEAGALLVGGHTVRDDELKYGLSVNGLVHPKRYTPNAGVRAGDALILTKPIGTGVHITASKGGKIERDVMEPVVESMATLNRVACEVMLEFGCRGATDITGFGLGGHALGMAQAGRVGIRFFFEAIPKFPRTLELIAAGVATGVTATNRQLTGERLVFQDRFTEPEQVLFADPQTSGGLLMAVPQAQAEALVRALHLRGVASAAVVAEVFAADPPRLEVVRRRP
jgi:selenide,water dikinase